MDRVKKKKWGGFAERPQGQDSRKLKSKRKLIQVGENNLMQPNAGLNNQPSEYRNLVASKSEKHG